LGGSPNNEAEFMAICRGGKRFVGMTQAQLDLEWNLYDKAWRSTGRQNPSWKRTKERIGIWSRCGNKYPPDKILQQALYTDDGWVDYRQWVDPAAPKGPAQDDETAKEDPLQGGGDPWGAAGSNRAQPDRAAKQDTGPRRQAHPGHASSNVHTDHRLSPGVTQQEPAQQEALQAQDSPQPAQQARGVKLEQRPATPELAPSDQRGDRANAHGQQEEEYQQGSHDRTWKGRHIDPAAWARDAPPGTHQRTTPLREGHSWVQQEEGLATYSRPKSEYGDPFPQPQLQTTPLLEGHVYVQMPKDAAEWGAPEGVWGPQEWWSQPYWKSQEGKYHATHQERPAASSGHHSEGYPRRAEEAAPRANLKSEAEAAESHTGRTQRKDHDRYAEEEAPRTRAPDQPPRHQQSQRDSDLPDRGHSSSSKRGATYDDHREHKIKALQLELAILNLKKERDDPGAQEARSRSSSQRRTSRRHSQRDRERDHADQRDRDHGSGRHH
jgi:hypothetical protein